MTHEQFLEWIDKEIEEAEYRMDRENRKTEPDLSYNGRLNALEEVKTKFLAITPPTTLS